MAMTLPFEQGFIDDESGRDYEAHEPYEFLITGRPPKIGQRIQSYVDLPAKCEFPWARFSGIVTEVGAEPTTEAWIATSFWALGANTSGDDALRVDRSSKCPDCGDDVPSCWNCKIFDGSNSDSSNKLWTVSELKQRCKAVMGALHGQEITTFAYLKFFGDQVPPEPYAIAVIYKICFLLNDSKVVPWCISSIEDVTNSLPIQELPPIFKNWDAGREQGMVAPYDQSPAERKKHALGIQEFLVSLKESMEGEDDFC